MNRDAILATLIGFGIGLLVTGILIISPSLVKSLPRISLPKLGLPQTQPKAPPTSVTPSALTLTLDSPLPESVESKNELLVSGKTNPMALVIIQGPLDESVTTADGEGRYAGKITLSEGKNEIKSTAYGNNQQSTQTAVVFYTPEEF